MYVRTYVSFCSTVTAQQSKYQGVCTRKKAATAAAAAAYAGKRFPGGEGSDQRKVMYHIFFSENA